MDIRNKLALEDVKSFLTRLWQQKKISIIAFGIAVVVILGAMLFTFAPSKDNQLHIMSTEEQKANREGAYSDSLSEPAPERTIFVHVAGSVSAPGLYELQEGARVNDAIKLAGWFTAEADQTSLNLARALTDGEQLFVPSKNSESGSVASNASISLGSDANVSGTVPKINVNRANEGDLQSIPGVGPSLAAKIIKDRESNGPFASVDDLTRVSGIGEKKLESMREFITIG